MRKGTREAVIAWREAETKVNRIYEINGQQAHDAVVAAGGWITSSPSEKGFCHVFEARDECLWPDSGVSRSGEHNRGVGPHANKVSPHCPEIGDRIRKLEKEHREAIFAMQAAQTKVSDLYMDIIDDPNVRSGGASELLTALVRAMVETKE
jgi:hypothetical protein